MHIIHTYIVVDKERGETQRERERERERESFVPRTLELGPCDDHVSATWCARLQHYLLLRRNRPIAANRGKSIPAKGCWRQVPLD